MQLPTFPARPVNGGRLELARPKFGPWAFEPKVNGWRALYHRPSRTLWNRHGEPLSIASEFQTALRVLDAIAFIDLFDLEALERRHDLMRGCLFVLDVVIPDASYSVRRALMEKHFPVFATVHAHAWRDQCSILKSSNWSNAAVAYKQLCAANKILKCPFYEGVVAKRTDKPYPIQNRDPKCECPFWMKHRFL